MITSISPEQWAGVEKIRQACIKRQTEQVPFDDCRQVVTAMWEKLGVEKPPLVVQVPGPIAMLEAFKFLHRLGNLLSLNLKPVKPADGMTMQLERFSSKLSTQVSEQLDPAVDERIDDDSTHNKLSAQLDDQVDASVFEMLFGENASAALDDVLLSYLALPLKLIASKHLDDDVESHLQSELVERIAPVLEPISTEARAAITGVSQAVQFRAAIMSQLSAQLSDMVKNSEFIQELADKLSSASPFLNGKTNQVRLDLLINNSHYRAWEAFNVQATHQTSVETRKELDELFPIVHADSLHRTVEPAAKHVPELIESLMNLSESILSLTLLGLNFNQLTSTMDGAFMALPEETQGKLEHDLSPDRANQLAEMLRDKVKDFLAEAAKRPSEAAISKFRQSLYSTIWWRAWASWYEGAAFLGVEFDKHLYDLFQQWCRCCPLIYPGTSVAIVCQNPISVVWNGDLLHNESGPAVEFADGFKIYSIDGITVDEQIVMAPETQTLQQIALDDNSDRKAIRIARYGWPRYLRETNALKIDSRDNELEGTKEALFALPDGETRLVVTCPTGRVFTMGVGDRPFEIKTCDEAQKWIHRGRVMLSRT